MRAVRDLVIVIGDAGGVPADLRRFHFVPPVRLLEASTPDRGESAAGETPLLFLLGRGTGDLPSLHGWLDHLSAAHAPPVVLLVPRDEPGWCALAGHRHCCGLLDAGPPLGAAEVERVLSAARRVRAELWGRQLQARGRLTWVFSTVEATDTERIWLVISSILSRARGLETELPRLGMAFDEALTNAVEHGNLELPSSLKDGAGGMRRFFAERARRLADPLYASRRIRVDLRLGLRELQIRLRNEGSGFLPLEGAVQGPKPEIREHPYGLGLRMIEGLVDRVEITPDGRGITLTTAWKPRIRRAA